MRYPTDPNNTKPPQVRLSVGFVLMPKFTMLPFAAFVDCLRLAADDGDASRPIYCRWSLMTSDGQEATSSCGATMGPCTTFQPPENFDYLVVCGGLLPDGPAADSATVAYLRSAAAARVPLVGLCTGPFAMSQAGLMRNRRCCVSWYHYHDLTRRFPDVIPVADRLFVVDAGCITCSGGIAAADLAAWMIERHVGKAWAQKSLHIMLIDHARRGNTAQPQPAFYDHVSDNRVRRAILIIEQRLSEPPNTEALAALLGISRRQLERAFQAELGLSPSRFSRDLRLRYGFWLLKHTRRSIAEVSAECGFADNAHFSRHFRKLFGYQPSQISKHNASLLSPSPQTRRPDPASVIFRQAAES
jgi:transcriptional regulator GlxA family with amidase domain